LLWENDEWWVGCGSSPLPIHEHELSNNLGICNNNTCVTVRSLPLLRRPFDYESQSAESLAGAVFAIIALGAGSAAQAQSSRYDDLSNIPLTEGYFSKEYSAKLKDELLFQRAVQSYLWAQPALNIFAMKEGSEKLFGKGYNVLPVWKERLNVNTQVTTPNSDVIYAMGYLDLKQDGPMVLEVPPGLQGILDDFFQRPICNPEPVAEKTWYPESYSKDVWCGDVGLPGPDKGKGADKDQSALDNVHRRLASALDHADRAVGFRERLPLVSSRRSSPH
jgi:hypothetical protein